MNFLNSKQLSLTIKMNSVFLITLQTRKHHDLHSLEEVKINSFITEFQIDKRQYNYTTELTCFPKIFGQTTTMTTILLFHSVKSEILASDGNGKMHNFCIL